MDKLNSLQTLSFAGESGAPGALTARRPEPAYYPLTLNADSPLLSFGETFPATAYSTHAVFSRCARLTHPPLTPSHENRLIEHMEWDVGPCVEFESTGIPPIELLVSLLRLIPPNVSPCLQTSEPWGPLARPIGLVAREDDEGVLDFGSYVPKRTIERRIKARVKTVVLPEPDWDE